MKLLNFVLPAIIVISSPLARALSENAASKCLSDSPQAMAIAPKLRDLATVFSTQAEDVIHTHYLQIVTNATGCDDLVAAMMPFFQSVLDKAAAIKALGAN